MTSRVITYFAILGLCACGPKRTEILDEYYVYKYSDHHDGENVLFCKLSCENDPVIENVELVEWNDSTIIVKTNSDNFIIEGSEKFGLCCCCENQVIGPLNNAELNEFKERTNFVSRNRKEIK